MFLVIGDRKRLCCNFSQGYGNIRPCNNRIEAGDWDLVLIISGIFLSGHRISLTGLWHESFAGGSLSGLAFFSYFAGNSFCNCGRRDFGQFFRFSESCVSLTPDFWLFYHSARLSVTVTITSCRSVADTTCTFRRSFALNLLAATPAVYHG